MSEKADIDLLMSFIMSLTLCDHMGDVDEMIADVLDRVGLYFIEWETREQLFDELEAQGYVFLSARNREN